MIYVVSGHRIILFLLEHFSMHPRHFRKPRRIPLSESFKFFFKQSERTVFIIVINARFLYVAVGIRRTHEQNRAFGIFAFNFFIMVSIAVPNLI